MATPLLLSLIMKVLKIRKYSLVSTFPLRKMSAISIGLLRVIRSMFVAGPQQKGLGYQSMKHDSLSMVV